MTLLGREPSDLWNRGSVVPCRARWMGWGAVLSDGEPSRGPLGASPACHLPRPPVPHRGWSTGRRLHLPLAPSTTPALNALPGSSSPCRLHLGGSLVRDLPGPAARLPGAPTPHPRWLRWAPHVASSCRMAQNSAREEPALMVLSPLHSFCLLSESQACKNPLGRRARELGRPRDLRGMLVSAPLLHPEGSLAF